MPTLSANTRAWFDETPRCIVETAQPVIMLSIREGSPFLQPCPNVLCGKKEWAAGLVATGKYRYATGEEIRLSIEACRSSGI